MNVHLGEWILWGMRSTECLIIGRMEMCKVMGTYIQRKTNKSETGHSWEVHSSEGCALMQELSEK